MTAQELRAAVDRVADDTEIKAAVRKMQAVVRSVGGPQVAADAVEAHLKQLRPIGKRRETTVRDDASSEA